jgi:hypothetical protein
MKKIWLQQAELNLVNNNNNSNKKITPVLSSRPLENRPKEHEKSDSKAKNKCATLKEEVMAHRLINISKYNVRDKDFNSGKELKKTKSKKSVNKFQPFPTLEEFVQKENDISQLKPSALNIETTNDFRVGLFSSPSGSLLISRPSSANPVLKVTYPRPRSSPCFRQSIINSVKFVNTVDASTNELPNNNKEYIYDAAQAEDAQRMWSEKISVIRRCGQSVQYSDITKFSTTFTSNRKLLGVAKYLCALLGVQSKEDAIRRSLFRELFPLLKFLREVLEYTRLY